MGELGTEKEMSSSDHVHHGPQGEANEDSKEWFTLLPLTYLNLSHPTHLGLYNHHDTFKKKNLKECPMGESPQGEQLVPLGPKPCSPDPARHFVESLIREFDVSCFHRPSTLGQ